MTNHRKIEEEEEKQYKIANKMAPTMISYRGQAVVVGWPESFAWCMNNNCNFYYQ